MNTGAKRPAIQPEKPLVWLLAAILFALSLLSFAYTGLKLFRTEGGSIFWLSAVLAVAVPGLCIPLFFALKKTPPKLLPLWLFLLALIPRLLFGMLAECAPVSDFANYHQFALWLHAGNRQAVQNIAQAYQLTEFAGLAVLNYALSLIFTAGLGGMQFASMVMSACIAVLIYSLGAQYRKSCGLAAALVYIFYPGAILASQILTNQHGATLFTLLSFLFLLRALRSKRFFPALGYASIGGVLLVISHFFHPSSIVTQIAVFCFLIFFAWTQKRGLLRALALSAAFLLTFQLALFAGTSALRHEQLLPAELETNSALAKIVVGLNPATGGTYSAEDYAAINATPSRSRNAYCIQIIKERISRPTLLLKTLAAKTFTTWVRTDNLFLFYEQGIEAGVHAGTPRAQTALAWAKALQHWDALFTAFLYAAAGIGVLCTLRQKPMNTCLRLLIWAILGWMAVHMLSEVQPRYRYYAMPMLSVFAGIGLAYLWQGRVWMKERVCVLFKKQTH